MAFLLVSPLLFAVNIYYIYEVFKWLSAIDSVLGGSRKKKHLLIKVIKIIYATAWAFATLSTYIAFLIPSTVSPLLSTVRRMLKLIGNYHLGICILMGTGLVPVLLARLLEYRHYRKKGLSLPEIRERFFNIRRSITGLVYVAVIIVSTLYGVQHAKDIKVNPYEISIEKDSVGISDIKIVLVADLHLGYNIGCDEMQKMVDLINAENADVVVIAGDIFDNEYDALDNPDRLTEILSSIQIRYGVYACYGNHDISEKIIGGFTFDTGKPKESSDEMDSFVEAAGITLLRDDYVLIEDSFYLYGRPDYERPGKGITKRLSADEITAKLDLSKPVIVIDHQPRELQKLADAGVDLDLCGHTHDGQFFPLNIASRLVVWENAAGLLMKDDMANIVTSGVGLFGPNIRIGTQAEICPITVHFTGKQ